ncbi:MAG: hypothetical protein WCJ25_04680 [Candidatus Moraniibacteriota bacterium]
MKKIYDPSFTVSWEGRQSIQKVKNAFVVAADLLDWKMEKIDVVTTKILDVDDSIRSEFHFVDEPDDLRDVSIVECDDEWSNELYMMRCASKVMYRGEGREEVTITIRLQNLYLDKEYDSVQMYLTEAYPGKSSVQWVQPMHLYSTAYIEFTSFLRGFKQGLKSTEIIDHDVNV